MKLVPAWVRSNFTMHHWAVSPVGPGSTERLTLCGQFWFVTATTPPPGQVQCGNCFRTKIFKGYVPLPVTITRYGVLV